LWLVHARSSRHGPMHPTESAVARLMGLTIIAIDLYYSINLPSLLGILLLSSIRAPFFLLISTKSPALLQEFTLLSHALAYSNLSDTHQNSTLFPLYTVEPTDHTFTPIFRCRTRLPHSALQTHNLLRVVIRHSVRASIRLHLWHFVSGYRTRNPLSHLPLITI
jgi:hypothetical protein